MQQTGHNLVVSQNYNNLYVEIEKLKRELQEEKNKQINVEKGSFSK